jgi:squalene-hopene/tetraprenyl-beta-curcumene cyclase
LSIRVASGSLHPQKQTSKTHHAQDPHVTLTAVAPSTNPPPTTLPPAPPPADPSALDAAITRATTALLAKQASAGYWVGELQGDSILESEYILLKWILNQEHDPDLPPIANYLRRLQEPHGGWALYPGGPPDISGCVKAYFALKLMGDDPNAPHMTRARALIRSIGGAEKCNTFTRFYFACLGQISFDSCPSIPPEVVFLPKWFYFNLYHVSAWTRTMILPLGIVTTLRPVRNVPDHLGIHELYLDPAAGNSLGRPRRGVPRSWADFFLWVDRLLKWYEQSPIHSLRAAAIKHAQKWMLDRMHNSEGLGAIFPPMVYMLIVFKALGRTDDDPIVQKAHKDLKDFYIREGDTIRLQPCVSPVWDTGIAMHALAETGLSPQSDAAQRSVQWLLDKEVRVPSDWQKNTRRVEPGAWFFEFQNPHYPDVDDTAMAVMSLRRLGGGGAKPHADAAAKRGIHWLLAMQNRDGGWAAFDKTKDRPILEAIPFADHNAMQDPSCPDITGRVLESLGHNGFSLYDGRVQRAIAFIKSHQDPAGPWWGRWGVNYVYGTWQVLAGLRSVGQNMTADFVRHAGDWLRSVQKADGSFGESIATYDDPSLKGTGDSTASQTAWGTMGLLAIAGPRDPAVQRGIDWLISHQAPDGAWDEPQFTGTGFPKVFYLKYHLYRHYFPLMALARHRRYLAHPRAPR